MEIITNDTIDTDSGVSSLRCDSERSGSRSSALSFDEVTPPPAPPVTAVPHPRIWRPAEMNHQTAQQQQAAAAAAAQQQQQHQQAAAQQAVQQAAAAAQHLYPPPLVGAYHPMGHVLWKRYPPGGQHYPVPAQDEYRERVYAHDRMLQHRERRDQEMREQLEKQQKEKERFEKMERERQQQERERQEKQRAAEQAVHKHFEESLRLAHQKRNTWQPSPSPSPSSTTSTSSSNPAAAAAASRYYHQHQQQQQQQQQQRNVPVPPPPAHHSSRSSSSAGAATTTTTMQKQVVTAAELTTKLPQVAEPNFNLFYPPPLVSNNATVIVKSPHRISPPQRISPQRMGTSPQPVSQQYQKSYYPSVSPKPQIYGKPHGVRVYNNPPPQQQQAPPPAHSSHHHRTAPIYNHNKIGGGAITIDEPLDLGVDLRSERITTAAPIPTPPPPPPQLEITRVQSPPLPLQLEISVPRDLEITPTTVVAPPVAEKRKSPSPPIELEIKKPRLESPPPAISPPPAATTPVSEKSNSPGPSKTGPTIRHLKKAWLQRHTTGEDVTSSDSSSVNCVTPLTTGGGCSSVDNGGSKNGDSSPTPPPIKKRGRRPKKTTPLGATTTTTTTDPFRKPSVAQLKKTGETWLQDGPCFEVAPKLAKCRECRWTPNQRSKNMPNIFCRFYAFRRLRYTQKGQLAIAGFSDPYKDATEDDLKLWLPMADSTPPDLDLEISRFLLKCVGDQFCDLLVQEKDAHNEHMSEDKTIAWKRVVQGVREMCDVCETTLFNFHWACAKCGFVVCLDCYKGRKNGTIKIWNDHQPIKDMDEFSWLTCTNRSPHEPEKLMLTQIIAGDSLYKLGHKLHETRHLQQIPQHCECPLVTETTTTQQPKDNNKKTMVVTPPPKIENGGGNNEQKPDKLTWLVALSDSDSDEDEDKFSTLRDLLIRDKSSSPSSGGNKQQREEGEEEEDMISMVVEDTLPDEERKQMKEMGVELRHYVRRYKWEEKGREKVAIRIMTLTESREMYPDVPHSWLCDGKLLRLTEPENPKNYKIFQDQWKRGQPVIVSNLTTHLNKELWHPDSFTRDFGDARNDLINCITGNLVPNQPMRKFWDGFLNSQKRLKDEQGTPMLLKLKDWPSGEDFAELLPSRFHDLMKILPLSEYTQRTGNLNLAARLPECFVRPDLGPKMYNAYGSAASGKGTTNLHLDVSDAVNVMCYVGLTDDVKDAFKAIDEAGCDILTRRRVRENELPGALWHIYHARDADKIRDLLNKVALENGGRLEPHHDPIHDQSCYLDGALRERLYKEYNVEGYAIVQCLGDAVFIPAGAPHQVRNLHNCIKVAEDFVSPENVEQCFHLTQEFRALSDTHTNHEDKLQIKNIIYHTVKDAVSVLMQTNESDSDSDEH